jgi:hypothetical protein
MEEARKGSGLTDALIWAIFQGIRGTVGKSSRESYDGDFLLYCSEQMWGFYERLDRSHPLSSSYLDGAAIQSPPWRYCPYIWAWRRLCMCHGAGSCGSSCCCPTPRLTFQMISSDTSVDLHRLLDVISHKMEPNIAHALPYTRLIRRTFCYFPEFSLLQLLQFCAAHCLRTYWISRKSRKLTILCLGPPA